MAAKKQQQQQLLLLREAVKQNDIEIIKAILQKEESKTDINQEDDNGITPLIEACIEGNAAIVELFLHAGCPAQPNDGFRHTPLRGAVVCGHYHLIPMLLQHGADPNALSEGNRTPLMGACYLRKGVPVEHSVQCVEELLKDERTDPTLVNNFGESALDLAKIRGYNESSALVEKALGAWDSMGK